LQVDKKQLVFFILCALSADQRGKIKGQAAFLQRLPALLGDPADLRGKYIDRFEQMVKRFCRRCHGLFEISHRFVAQGSQARGHDEHRLMIVLVNDTLRATTISLPDKTRVSAMPTSPSDSLIPRQNVIRSCLLRWQASAIPDRAQRKESIEDALVH
jgi:hypothetical protein